MQIAQVAGRRFGGIGRICRRDADDVGVGAAIVEELLDAVAEQRAAIETAIGPLEIGEARDAQRTIDRSGARAQPMNSAIDVATPVIVRTPLGISSM